jgi:hypothetical protein
MSGAETVVVTQADREAALKAAGFNDEGDLQYWGNSANRAEVAVLERAFARHPSATQADALAVMRVAEEWLRAIRTWLLETDNDMKLPDGVLDTDPESIADNLRAAIARADGA